MEYRPFKSAVVILLLAEIFVARCNGHLAENGAVFVEQWNNISGLTVQDLTNNSRYPNNYTTTYNMETFYLGKQWRENFGMRIRSYFQAPLTGNHTFYTKCDDSCLLYMSGGINPKDKKILIDHKVGSGTGSGWRVLEEGKLYYIEMIFKQGKYVAEFNVAILLPNKGVLKHISEQYLKRSVGELDQPGKDCTKSNNDIFPDYINCKKFTQIDKLNAVKTNLKELQSNIQEDDLRPTTEVLEHSMKIAARRITFLLDDTGGPQPGQVENDNEGLEVAREVEQLGNMVAEQLNQSQSIAMEYPNIMMQIKKLENNFVFPDKQRDSLFQTSDEISIKTSPSENILVFSSLYKNLGDLLKGNITALDGHRNGRFFLNSRIIASSLIPRPKSFDKESIRLKLQHKKFKRSKEQTMMCVFWNFNSSVGNSTGAWSSEGCRMDEENSNENFTVCLCDHLTHFAVLMKVTEDDEPLSKDHVTALQAITYVGCSLSLIGELLTIVTLTCLRLTKAETNMIHLNLVIALGFAQIFFLSGITATEIKAVCTFVAVALHFFNLVAFFWMLVEGLWLYVMVVRVFDTGYNRIKRYIIAAWSIPAVIVIVTLVSSFDGYGTEHSCWLSIEKGTVWSFAAPVLVIIVVNAVILALVVREILKLHNPTPADDSKLQTAKSGVKSAAVLLPILGIAWVFGILAVNSHTYVFQYLFAIFNSLQGFLIFIFHCVLNSEVRKAFRRKKQIWSANQIFSCHTSTPHSQPKYDSDLSKETRSTSNGVEKRPNSSTSTSKIIIK